jgi:hypothetical protein
MAVEAIIRRPTTPTQAAPLPLLASYSCPTTFLLDTARVFL